MKLPAPECVPPAGHALDVERIHAMAMPRARLVRLFRVTECKSFLRFAVKRRNEKAGNGLLEEELKL
jgi:hypothetical protein